MKPLQQIGLGVGLAIIFFGLCLIHKGLAVAFFGSLISALAAADIMLDAYKEELLRQKRGDKS